MRDEYVDTMGKIMFSYFKSYTGRLDRCHLVFAYFHISSNDNYSWPPQAVPYIYHILISRLQYEESASREDLLGTEETQVNI